MHFFSILIHEKWQCCFQMFVILKRILREDPRNRFCKKQTQNDKKEKG